MQMDEIVAIGSLLVALTALLSSRLKETKAETARHQLMDDKLDRNNEIARETRDAVRDMSKKLDDHAERLTKAEERIDTLFRRVSRIEKGCDMRLAAPENTD